MMQSKYLFIYQSYIIGASFENAHSLLRVHRMQLTDITVSYVIKKKKNPRFEIIFH